MEIERSRVAAIRFFADLPEDELAAIAGVASEVEIPSGQALATEGRIGHSLFAIDRYRRCRHRGGDRADARAR